MDKPLKIKDPIYGYITIQDDDIYNVLNSTMFHRLQDIRQTSYSAVYPSSVHNRFTHSLGVYFLGLIASNALQNDILSNALLKKNELEKICKTFLLACLMHDIGHSPFSHTGEKFYFERKDKGVACIWKSLVTALNDDKTFDKDAKYKEHGAPHEIMSALVSVICFNDTLNEFDISFFARCIVGLKYSDKNDIRNCFIDLLNSKTIDVDKLDYLIRDSYLTGFKSVCIDYERLLTSVCIVNLGTGYELGFKKSALSTLESVILAHDMERKWIQNHPVIKYESYLISYLISEAIKYYKRKKIDLFSAEALTQAGISRTSHAIRLLGDSDILFLAKNCLNQDDEFVTQYFGRNKRKKPLWKSEAEYRIYTLQSCYKENALTVLENRFKSIENSLVSKFGMPIINDETYSYFKNELDKAKSYPQQIRTGIEKELNTTIDLFKHFEDYSKKHGLPFSYIVISANQFNTGFNKQEFKDIKVKFSDKTVKPLSNILYLFDAKEPRENFFYIFVDSSIKDQINLDDFTNSLFKFIVDNYRN